MTWTVDNSGTLASVVGTETDVDSAANNATYVFFVDLGAMANGDITELRVYTVVLSGGLLRQAWKATYGPIPPYNLIAVSPPIASDIQFVASIKQIAGTARSYPWKVLRT